MVVNILVPKPEDQKQEPDNLNFRIFSSKCKYHGLIKRPSIFGCKILRSACTVHDCPRLKKNFQKVKETLELDPNLTEKSSVFSWRQRVGKR
jgi:hypothetical protein